MKTLVPQLSTKEFFTAILPPFGTKVDSSFNTPHWVAGMKMYMIKDYLHPSSGSYYYEGVRCTDNIFVFEKDCEWGRGQWCYLNELIIFAFDGTTPKLIDKRTYTNTFRNEGHIRAEIDDMIQSFLKSQAKLHGQKLNNEELKLISTDCVNRLFKDLLDEDYDINVKLTRIIPLLEQK